jgi:Lrp/AsnC family transcriptional regulator, leucine-responsive regulatory protein
MYKIDKKDRNILTILNDNCRESNSKIGKMIGLSRDSVAYRINNLEKEGIIENYTIEINYEELGYTAFSFAVKLQNVSQEAEEKIINFLIKNKSIVFIEETLSKYDLAFIILAKSLEQVDEETKSIRQFIGNNLKYIDMGISLEIFEFPTFLFDYRETPIKINNKKSYNLDSKDKQILSELVKNSKITAVDLSTKINLSVFAIADRIKKLHAFGIIHKFKAIINTEKLGYHKYTILLNLFNSKIEKQLLDFCRAHKQIWEIDKSLSNYNYAIEVYAKNNEEFKNIVDEVMGTFSKSIIDYETLIVLKKIKHSYLL